MLRKDQAIGLTHVHESPCLRKKVARHIAFARLANLFALQKVRGLALERRDSGSLVLCVSSHDIPLTNWLFSGVGSSTGSTRPRHTHVTIRACDLLRVQ